MLELGKRLNSNSLTKEDLIEHVTIEKTSFEDIYEIMRIMNECFKIPTLKEAYVYLYEHKTNINNSVKLIDKRTNEIYGILLLGETDMTKVTPLPMSNPILNNIISRFKQINGIAFIIDERLRGCGFDKKMLYHNLEYINKHELVWCGVDPSLKSHNYWKRLGFFEITSVPFAKFYAKFIKH